MSEKTLTIREALVSDEPIIAEHLRLIAIALGVSSHSMRQDWLERTLQFIKRARQDLGYKGFIAEIGDAVVGSTSCQILELYPMVSEAYQKGYIWGVYVNPACRRHGVATKLMNQAMVYLKEIGCTKAVLHASETGKLLYAKLGYVESNEMVFGLDAIGR